jgi:glycine/D-amino acid oxidase-like deaminating enzyme
MVLVIELLGIFHNLVLVSFAVGSSRILTEVGKRRAYIMVAFSKIVIAGGGVIGSSISYYLAKANIASTIIDPVGIAPAASGKAGGFLARDWSDGSPIGLLQQRSFDLHAQQAEDLGAATIDYRRLECVAVGCDERATFTKPSGKKLQGVEWADINVLGSRIMGGTDTIAQVHPKKLCDAMWKYSQDIGSKLIIGKVVEAIVDDSGSITGVKLDDGSTIDCDALVIACGPWTGAAKSWFPTKVGKAIPQMLGVKYHSILIQSPRVLNQAVFFSGHGDPEVYPRPDGDAYITGFPDPAVVVTESPGNEEIRPDVVSRLVDATKKVSSELGPIPPHTEQSCYLPTTNDGIPVIGEIPGVKGAYIGGGHGCWGILNGPATGEAIAELLTEGETKHVDIKMLGVDSPYRR